MRVFFNPFKYFVIPFLLLFLFLSITICWADHNALSADGSSPIGTGRTTLAQLIGTERKRQTLADLIAEERDKEENNDEKAKGTPLGQLIEMESIDGRELDEFMGQMGENEQLIEQVFQQQETQRNAVQLSQKEGKGIVKKLIKMLSKKKNKKKELDEKVVEEKYRKLNIVKETDPAMAQIMEKLQSYIIEIKSGKISKPLKQYLIFVINFLAKRQGISISEIVPMQKTNTKKTLSELVKLIVEQNRENKPKNGQSEEKNGQNGDKNEPNCKSQKKFKSNKAKEERMLRILLTAVENINGNLNLAMEFNQSKGKRRKKRLANTMIILVIFLMNCVISLLFVAAYSSTHCSAETTSKFKTRLAQRKIVKALHKIPQQNVIESELEECAICLNTFEMGQKVRPIPPCQHKFHTDCIDKWVKQHNNCPICRSITFKFSLLKKAKPNDEQPEEQQEVQELHQVEHPHEQQEKVEHHQEHQEIEDNHQEIQQEKEDNHQEIQQEKEDNHQEIQQEKVEHHQEIQQEKVEHHQEIQQEKVEHHQEIQQEKEA